MKVWEGNTHEHIRTHHNIHHQHHHNHHRLIMADLVTIVTYI